MVRQGIPLASYGKMTEVSTGKDSTSGHWEIGGVQLILNSQLIQMDFPMI